MIKIPDACPTCKEVIFVPPCKNNMICELLPKFVDAETLKLIDDLNKEKSKDQSHKIYKDVMKSKWRFFVESSLPYIYPPHVGPVGFDGGVHHPAPPQVHYHPQLAVANPAEVAAEVQAAGGAGVAGVDAGAGGAADPQDKDKKTQESESELELIKETLSCPVCREVVCEAVTLLCQHTFCRDCLGHTTVHKCPMCNLHFNTLPKNDNMLILHLVKATVDPEIVKKHERIKQEKNVATAVVPVIQNCIDHALQQMNDRGNRVPGMAHYNPIRYIEGDGYLCRNESKFVRTMRRVQSHLCEWSVLYYAGFVVSIVPIALLQSMKKK